MKKAQREIYLILARESLPEPFDGELGLCNLCQWAEWTGSCCGDDGDLICHHPLWEISEYSDDVWQGGDCWAFRPEYNLEDTADMVGMFLQGYYPDMSECRAKKAFREAVNG